ncbi:hypothetical protein LTR64_006765 [Lithohypha guttulata]|uniref:uncharacterized protein n=1 Tax=Lithohypha guttulata TaxID=1690604 RepID=UPI002DDEE39F|nr:hypothetical protein LTR51_004677 [Lithohypha guttulata]
MALVDHCINLTSDDGRDEAIMSDRLLNMWLNRTFVTKVRDVAGLASVFCAFQEREYLESLIEKLSVIGRAAEFGAYANRVLHLSTPSHALPATESVGA